MVNVLQHKLEILATKPCMVLKEKKCIFIKNTEVFDMKNFQQKDCIFLWKKITIKVHCLVDLLLSAFLPVCLALPLESVLLYCSFWEHR